MNKSSRVKSRASAHSTSRKARVLAKIAGSRVGGKFRDMRWQSPDGAIWASRFEYGVYSKLRELGHDVRRTSPEDRISYTHPVRGGLCTQCNSHEVVTERHYTPDLFVVPRAGQGAGRGDAGDPTAASRGYYIEAKGYLRADGRSLLRSLRKARPDIDLRILAQRDYKVGKSTFTGWVTKFLKIPVHVWTTDGKLPEEWK